MVSVAENYFHFPGIGGASGGGRCACRHNRPSRFQAPGRFSYWLGVTFIGSRMRIAIRRIHSATLKLRSDTSTCDHGRTNIYSAAMSNASEGSTCHSFSRSIHSDTRSKPSEPHATLPEPEASITKIQTVIPAVATSIPNAAIPDTKSREPEPPPLNHSLRA